MPPCFEVQGGLHMFWAPCTSLSSLWAQSKLNKTGPLSFMPPIEKPTLYTIHEDQAHHSVTFLPNPDSYMASSF